MNHHASWGHPPRKPKRKGVRFLIVVVLYALATGAMVLIAGGQLT